MLIQIQIAPHSDNRLLKVSAMSDLFCWHGEQLLQGLTSPRTVMFDVREVPAGRYYVKGEILGPEGESRGAVARHVTVAPRAAPAGV